LELVDCSTNMPTQAHCRGGQPRAAHAEGEVPGADGGLFQQVGGLHQHLHRQSGRQHLQQIGVFRRVVATGRDADQVVGETRQVVGGERLRIEGLEDQVVLGLDVVAL
jgi:hypothetical protein